MPDIKEIRPCGTFDAVVRPPGSKSITNRALICAALAEGPSTLTGVLDSEDTRVMIGALEQLGFAPEHDVETHTLKITGLGCDFPQPPTQDENAGPAEIYIANSGTTVRFLTAALSLARTGATYRLHGTPRMGERPIRDLLDALHALGADVQSETETGCPPVLIRGQGLQGGTARVAGDISSQFLSALLMCAPGAQEDVILEVEGVLVSKPYVTMTLEVMRSFGADVQAESDLSRFVIPKASGYSGTDYSIEPDASAASYFFAAAAVTGSRITVEGLTRDALQGDVGFCDCLEKMGCQVEYGSDSITLTGGPLTGIDVDMNAISDTVQSLAVVALFADGPTRITNVGHIRYKETDRIAAVATELRKFGATVEEWEDGMLIHPPASLRPAEIDTYDDHRMAMSFAIAGLRQPGVVIRDPGCTAKTYPLFFEDLERVTGT